MPSLKLSNPFRRGDHRPSLKQRAASLKATAARVINRKPANPSDGAPCPTDFILMSKAPSALGVACDWAIGHIDWINTTAGSEDWDDARLDDECEKSDAIWERAVAEPSTNVGDVAAKARLLLQDLEGELSDTGRELDRRGRMTFILLREVAALVPPATAGTGYTEIHPALLQAVRSFGLGKASADALPRMHIDCLDITSADLRTLAAIHDAARLIGGVADAVSCQPRCYTPRNERWNVVGLFADAISGACGSVQVDAVREAQKRAPSDDWERGVRLTILSQDTIENGDKNAASAFARELLAMG